MTIPTNDELNKMSLKQLLELFNTSNPPKQVKAFRDKGTALARVIALRDGTKAAPRPRKTAAAKPAKKAKKAKTEGVGRTRKPFDLPARKEIKEARPETKRADVVAMLGSPSGATVEEVMEKQKWNRREALEGIRLLHKLLGFGLRESAEGRIHLVRS
jgi:hypothetical protein